ncbi:hypothetical protein [Polycladidibacter hongkongensis]|uniref:hypothetical protein n=1 Tax=Polycladidibacter hongkongensis TaxID=1647556 RepID=UPI0008365016|nr:hypothetical protein [Pseudovibrio hongkongensis]
MPAIADTISGRTAGIIVFSSDEVLYKNTKAEKLLSKGILRVGRDGISCKDPDANSCLRLAQQSNQAQNCQPILLQNQNDGRQFLLKIIAPINTAGESKQACSAIIVEIGEEEEIDDEDVMQFGRLFQLTKSETLVLSAVLRLMPLKQYAEQQGIQLDTAHKQLKQVMQKLCVNNQKSIFRKFERYRFIS